MTVVCDASVVVSAVIQDGARGQWASSLLQSELLLAPHILPAEVAHALRHREMTGHLSSRMATTAYAEMLALDVDLRTLTPLAARIWELRHNVTPYDAWYIALAEAEGLQFATLDRRLALAPGVRCGFLLPPP